MTITRLEPQRRSLWRRIADWLEAQRDDDPLAPAPIESTATATTDIVRQSSPPLTQLQILKRAALIESRKYVSIDAPELALVALERYRSHFAAASLAERALVCDDDAAAMEFA
jgi:hypothetical protein